MDKWVGIQEVDFSELPSGESADMLVLFPTTKEAPPIQLHLSMTWIHTGGTYNYNKT